MSGKIQSMGLSVGIELTQTHLLHFEYNWSMRKLFVLVGTALFPYVYLHTYLLYGFLFGMVSHYFTGAAISGFSMALVPYLVYVAVLLFIFWRVVKSAERLRWSSVFLICLFWFIAQLFYFSGGFFIPKQGWVGKMDWQQNETNWWLVNRYTPLYPFQPLGEGLTKNEFRTPKGYLSFGSMYYKNPLTEKWDIYAGSHLIPFLAVPHAFLFGSVHAILFYVFARKKGWFKP